MKEKISYYDLMDQASQHCIDNIEKYYGNANMVWEGRYETTQDVIESFGFFINQHWNSIDTSTIPAFEEKEEIEQNVKDYLQFHFKELQDWWYEENPYYKNRLEVTEDVEDIVESYDFSIIEYSDSYELLSYTDRGVEMYISIDKNINYSLPAQLQRWVENFDEDEEIMYLRQDNTYRCLFTIRDSLEDLDSFVDGVKALIKELWNYYSLSNEEFSYDKKLIIKKEKENWDESSPKIEREL